MTTKVIQQVTEMETKEKSNVGLYFGNRWNKISELIEPDDVGITGVYN